LSRPETIGRRTQVIDRWIYTACLCFGLDLADQARSGFRYDYSVYQVEYSRNLLFASGAVMEREERCPPRYGAPLDDEVRRRSPVSCRPSPGLSSRYR
jgi:hypothetical protein